MKTSLKASLIATAIATLPFGSQAAGLGPINVLSALGQPLRAEIELNATPHELQSLQARIASAEAFRQANLSYSAMMPALKLAVETRGSRAVVRVSSDRPINEPFVDLLVELDWASGRLIREYTFLLDPAPAGTTPPPVAAQIAAPTAPAAAVAPGTSARGPAASAPRGAAAGERYEVRRGDTLRMIAEANRPPAASLDQMLIALFRENPDAFEGGNINRMRAGAILSVPAEPDVMAVEPAQARREVVAQAADFDAYRRKMAGAVASRPAAPEAPSSRAGAGAIVPKIDEPQRPGATGDQVKVSPSSSPDAAQPSGDSARLARLQALEEELAARDKALEEANSRLAALEASIREMQQLLEIRSQSLGQAPATPSAPAAADAATSAPAAQAPAAPAPKPEQPPAQAQAPADQPKPETKPSAEKPAVPPAEPGFFASLFDDPRLLAAGGGVLALLLGYAGLKSRERRKAAQVGSGAAGAVSELPPVTNSVFGATGGQNVNTTGDSSVIHTDFSQSGLSAIDADEGVDPVAEADVYMAYGRDAQAEEILLDALKADTSRPAIFLKLLEIYAQRKSLKQFETTASELYARTGGEGHDWEKAAEMGRKIDPDNPLYGNSPASARAAESRPAAAAAGFGLGVGAAAVAAQFDDTDAAPQGADAAGPTLDDLDFATQRQPALAPAAMESPAGELTLPEVDVQASRDGEILDALPEIDAGALDFDLDAGLGLGEPASAVSAAPAAVAEPAEFPLEDLELDLDLGGEAGAAAVDRSPMNQTMVGDGRDFADAVPDLQFESAAEPEAPAATAEGMEFDLSATSLSSEPALEAAPAAADDLEKTTFDSSLLDFDFNLEDSAAPEAAVAPAVDLSTIDLELPASTTARAGALDLDAEQPDLAPPGATAAEAPAAEVLQEVDTKLELARAYEEMGDKEGARELLEEVLREGSADQREAADRLLERLV